MTMYRAKFTAELLALGDRLEFWSRPYRSRARCSAAAKRSGARARYAARRYGPKRLRVGIEIVEIGCPRSAI